jgi:metabolite-proton symporter
MEKVMTAPSLNSSGNAAIASSSITKTVVASLVGTSLEWYDFFIYGSAAALVFPHLFFPQSDPATALLLSLASYGVAYVARPLGAVIFGHYGDKLGRKAILTTTILLMGISTFLIGLLPTYPAIGTFAPIGLVLLRFIQGIALGGEWGGAALMVTEFDPKGRRRGFLGSLVQVAVPIGLLSANGVFAVATYTMSPESFLAWGWRIPFLLSATLVIVGYFIRRNLSETPLFAQVEATQNASTAPIVDVLRTSTKQIVLGLGSRIGSDIAFYIFTLFLLVYVPKQLGLPSGLALSAILVASAFHIFAIPFFGALSDRFGRRPILIGGAAITIIWSCFFFTLLDTKSPALIILASVVGLFCHAAMWGPLASYLPEMFETRVRCTGASLSFQLAGILGNAPAPIIATQLLLAYNSPWPVTIYMVAFLLLMIICVAISFESAHIDLSLTGDIKELSKAAARPEPLRA